MTPSARSPTLGTELDFDVLVVGAGHAGTEAAVAAARVGVRVGLVTSALETIGQMSCNPAIGGVAKGTVVREVDALGGIMGRATDLATLQFRMLNRSKGPAVWAPRAQCDRGLYRRAVRSLVERQPRVHPSRGRCARLLFDPADGGRRVVGIETIEGRRFGAAPSSSRRAPSVAGALHIGTDRQVSGGRAGEAAATHLTEQLESLGLTVGRFKTGTPPRIDGRSVDFAALEVQESEIEQFDYSVVALLGDTAGGDGGGRATRHSFRAGSPSWVGTGSRSSPTTLAESAMYGGAIASRGPRYCPSVEDKIVKFPDAEKHQIFLEPEGHDTTELYVNGLSTSLPAPVQLEILRTVPGLERVQMTRAGYAIEYDYYPPTQLDATLAVRAVAGLYFAGPGQRHDRLRGSCGPGRHRGT